MDRRDMLRVGAVGSFAYFLGGPTKQASAACESCGDDLTGTCGGSLEFHPIEVFRDFSSRAPSAIAPLAKRIAGKRPDDALVLKLAELKAEVLELGAVTTPSGDTLYANVYVEEDDAKDSAGGAFYTEVGEFRVVTVMSTVADMHRLEAGVLKGDEMLAAFTVEFTAVRQTMGGFEAVNSGGALTFVDAEILPGGATALAGVDKDCIIRCVKRHAPKCIPICTRFGYKACIACGGAVAACCLVNCQC